MRPSTSPLASLTDMKGEKWRTASFWHRDFLRNAGATPVSIPWGEGVFNALREKALDGLIVNIDSGYMLKVHEVAPHVVASKDLWLGHVYLLAMNSDTWAALAEEDKDAVRRAAETAYKMLGSVMESSFPAMVKDMEKEGVKIRLLTGSEVDAFEAATKYRDVQAAWARAQEEKGVKEVGPTLEKVRAILKDAAN